MYLLVFSAISALINWGWYESYLFPCFKVIYFTTYLIGIFFIYFCNIVKLIFKDALKVFMTYFGIDRGSIYMLH